MSRLSDAFQEVAERENQKNILVSLLMSDLEIFMKSSVDEIKAEFLQLDPGFSVHIEERKWDIAYTRDDIGLNHAIFLKISNPRFFGGHAVHLSLDMTSWNRVYQVILHKPSDKKALMKNILFPEVINSDNMAGFKKQVEEALKDYLYEAYKVFKRRL